MKILTVFFLLLVIHNEHITGACIDAIQSERFTEPAVIHQLFELIRSVIRKGSTELELPILDPYVLNYREIRVNGEIFSANANITNGILTGFGGFILQQFNFSKDEIFIELNVKWPLLTFYSEYYELKGSLYDAVPLLGQGKIDIEVRNIELWSKVYMKQSADGKSILMEKIENAQFSIDKIVSRTEFDNNIDAILNALVEDSLASYLTRFSKFLAAAYNRNIVEILNPLLEKLDSWNIIMPILY